MEEYLNSNICSNILMQYFTIVKSAKIKQILRYSTKKSAHMLKEQKLQVKSNFVCLTVHETYYNNHCKTFLFKIKIGKNCTLRSARV